ncbi:MAG TPA: hypothetical protein PLV52_06320, partial [Candidatus Omnitrophota bacterium]|nr:hypothetical protein [Candidatus Omnitrophota bacterium]
MNNLKSRTHYIGYKNEELVDYTQNFMYVKKQDGTENMELKVKDTTVYSYRTETQYFDVINYTLTYKGGTEDTKPSSGTLTAKSDYTGYLRNEEMLNYTFKYSGDNNNPSTTTVYFYGTGQGRAPTTTSGNYGHAMSMSATYNGNMSAGTTLKDTTVDALTSRNYYFGYSRSELMDYATNYMLVKDISGAQVKDTIVYTYGTGARSDILNYSTVYRGTDTDEDTGIRKSRTYFKGDVRGDEIADYVHNYTGDMAHTVSTTVVFFYGDSHSRADAVFYGLPMTASAIYKGDHSGGSYNDGLIADLKTKNYYSGYKGDELMDYTQSFSVDSSVSSNPFVKETTIYRYATASTDRDVIDYTITFKGGTINTKPGIGSLAYKSRTEYIGAVRGEEFMDYTLDYVGDLTTTVASSTVYFYGAGVRASTSLAGSSSMYALAKYDKDHSGAQTITTTDLRSVTYFIGHKGDELVNYVLNYGGSSWVKDTTVFTYEAGDVIDYVSVYRGNDPTGTGTLKSRNYYAGAVRGE